MQLGFTSTKEREMSADSETYGYNLHEILSLVSITCNMLILVTYFSVFVHVCKGHLKSQYIIIIILEKDPLVGVKTLLSEPHKS